jgi:phosphoglycolate phosphatase-like HAD superfamily hydrolase
VRIITDFDGVIMDLSDRYYHVYQLCLTKSKPPEQSVRVLSKAEFWALKRARIDERQIGVSSGLTDAQAEIFKQLRDLSAHQLEYLQFDRVMPGILSVLDLIRSNGIELLVMTLRRTSELNEAFDRCDLAQFFPHPYRYCLADNYCKQGDIQDKTNLMAQALTDLGKDEDTWMVGDTEADILAAQAHQIRVIGVLSGIRNRNLLEQYRPNAIVPNLAAAVDLILSGKATNYP